MGDKWKPVAMAWKEVVRLENLASSAWNDVIAARTLPVQPLGDYGEKFDAYTEAREAVYTALSTSEKLESLARFGPA